MINVNNKKYNSNKSNPVVIICMDGTSFDYYEGAKEVMPNLWRSEEHTSELQSRRNLVCRLLLEKKKIKK